MMDGLLKCSVVLYLKIFLKAIIVFLHRQVEFDFFSTTVLLML